MRLLVEQVSNIRLRPSPRVDIRAAQQAKASAAPTGETFMRFVVDCFRFIILAMCAIALIGAALLVIAAIDQSGPLGSSLTATIVAFAVAALAVLVLNIGGVAILISIHDRHVAIADNTHSIALSLAALADRFSTQETQR